MNDAFLGGTHCQDVRTIMPVFRNGELIAFVQNSAHWSDAGGPVPGSFHAEAAVDLRRGALHPADPPRARGRAGRRGACASSCATCACPTRRRATCSRRSPPAAPARRACRALIDKYGLDADQVRDGRADPLLGGAAARGVPQAARRHVHASRTRSTSIRWATARRPSRSRSRSRSTATARSTTSPAATREAQRRDQLDALDGAVGAGRRDEGDLPARARERGDLQRDRHRSTRRAWSRTRSSRGRSAAPSRPRTRSSPRASSAATCRSCPSARWPARGT